MMLTDLENDELVRITELLAKRIADGIIGECILHARVKGLDQALEKSLKVNRDGFGKISTLEAQVNDLMGKIAHLEAENKNLVGEVNIARQETLVSVEKMSGARVMAERKACYEIAMNTDTASMVAVTAAAAIAKRIRERGSW